MNPAMRLLVVLALVTTGATGPALAADAVVGSGTSASCDESDFDTALNAVQASGGGTITFNCGGQHIINFSNARTISSEVVIDGGGLITLSGNNATRHFIVASGVGASFGLRNITLAKGYAPSGDGGAIANGNNGDCDVPCG